MKVEVTIDRKLGSKHPKHGYVYPVNYGYLQGTLSGDGEELDAYVLGVSVPLDRFEGRCIAVLRRRSEADDKLIVVPEGCAIAPEEIQRQVDFQERYFESDLVLSR